VPEPHGDLRLTGAGLAMYRLMRLSTIPAEDQARRLDDLAVPVVRASGEAPNAP